MNDELHKQLEEMVAKMPAFPISVQRIIELTADMQCSPKELVQVIEHDPVMTMKILKLLNSAYYSLPRKITSIKRSVVYIGINTIKNVALSIATIGMLPTKSAGGFDTRKFLKHSLVTAAIAKLLNNKFNHVEFEGSDCFVAGLLHDIGKVVYAQYDPARYVELQKVSEENGISLFQAEQEVIGADHAVIGSMLGSKWQFPESLVDCIGEHHNVTNPGNEIRDCVIAADQLSKIIDLEDAQLDSEFNIELPPIVAERFGMGLKELLEYLGDFSAELDETNAYST